MVKAIDFKRLFESWRVQEMKNIIARQFFSKRQMRFHSSEKLRVNLIAVYTKENIHKQVAGLTLKAEAADVTGSRI